MAANRPRRNPQCWRCQKRPVQWGHLPPPLSHHWVAFPSNHRPHCSGMETDRDTAITAPHAVLGPILTLQPLASSAQLLPRSCRADTSPAGGAGQTDASYQPLLCRSRVTERQDRLILRLFIGISLGSAQAPRPRRAGAWLTSRHCGGFAMQKPPKWPRIPPGHRCPHAPLVLPDLGTKPH